MAKKKHVVNISDITDTHTMSNGAEVQRISFACEVCTHRNEEPGSSEFLVEYSGQQVHICGAHLQELLNAEGDHLMAKGGIFAEMFEMDKV